jgi:hypothetical protein
MKVVYIHLSIVQSRALCEEHNLELRAGQGGIVSVTVVEEKLKEGDRMKDHTAALAPD